MTFVITVTAVVRNKAAAVGATQWLADLPALVERVSTGLLCTEIGLQPGGREMLTVADRVAGEP